MLKQADPGAEFDVTINTVRDFLLRATCEVAWQSPLSNWSNPSYFATGVYFKELAPTHQTRFRDHLNHALASSLEAPLEIPAVSEKDLDALFKKLRKLYDRNSVFQKADLLSQKLGISLKHIKGCTYDTHYLRGNVENPIGIAQIPLGIAGPLLIKGKHASGEFWVPMATTEGAMVLTYDLGMRLLRLGEPVKTEVISKVVHLDPMFLIKTDEDVRVSKFIKDNYEEIKRVAECDSSHTTLLKIEPHTVKNNLVLKFMYDTADAHGLNMINHATFNACKYIESKTGASFYHRSHYSGVKHYSPLNEEKGYGRVVKASSVISEKALSLLHVTAKEVKEFCDRCIECGGAAGIRSVNVHAANAIAAIFLACGQDAADISSAHACKGRAEVVGEGKDLYWECMLWNLLVGTVGGGTHLGTQSECLSMLGCLGSGKSDKFAEIIAATVLAGEFTTAASIVNRTYVETHDKYGRNKKKHVP